MSASLADRRVLVVGAGGLGCPLAITLASAGVGVIGLLDDDAVALTNLHRQILYDDTVVGQPKVSVAAAALRTLVPSVDLRTYEARLLPGSAIQLVTEYDLVVEGSDNFATKFLAADACALAERPIVHGAAVRWHGTALAVARGGRPCYRCLFEDIPLEGAPNCAEAGVIGPMVGVVAAAQADLAISMLLGEDVAGELFTFDGKTNATRRRRVARRASCPLCGDARVIREIEPRRYTEGVHRDAR